MSHQKLFTAGVASIFVEHNGIVTVLRPLDPSNARFDPESGPMFVVRTATGIEFDASGDELTEVTPSPAFSEAFDKFIAQGRSDWPDIDGNLERPLRADTTVSPEAEPSDSDYPDPIILTEHDIDVDRSEEYIDVRMHDDSRPEHQSTVFACLTLDDKGARSVAHRLLTVSGPTIDEVVQRVLNETPDGDAFNLNDALRLAAEISRGEA